MKFKCLGLLILTLVAFYAKAGSASTNRPVIPFDQIGMMAGKQYHGDGLAVTPSSDGADLHCVFQRLSGQATTQGLWLSSTVSSVRDGPFRVVAHSLGRQEVTELSPSGDVKVTGQCVEFIRAGVTEDYAVGIDGIKQDFVIQNRPAGSGPVRLKLAASGAWVETGTGGADLVLPKSGRKIAYNRLQVMDATGKPLNAHIQTIDGHSDELAVVVEDAGAHYPVTIDPTFSDADWISLGGINGVDGDVYAAALDPSGNLYIGGRIGIAGNVIANDIAEWNGTNWSKLGSGMNGGVFALAISGTNLYAGGEFTTAGGLSAKYIAQWNGSSWSPLGAGMNNDVEALAISGGTLYAGGEFTTAGATGASYVAQWNGTNWSALGSGMAVGDAAGLSVNALAVVGANLYAGGAFTSAGGIAASNIAQWNGTNWSALGSGVNGYVAALAASASTLYAGGGFPTAGSIAASNIAAWNGGSWSALGSGINASSPDNGSPFVYALAVSGGNLYAGGYFTSAGGAAATNVAQWNGSSWSALGSGVTSYDDTFALAASGNTLYAAGSFTTAGGTAADNVAQWNGSSWSSLGSGVNFEASALVVSGGNLYMGGYFTVAGAATVGYIAQWNGSSWSSLGSGMSNGDEYGTYVSALAVSGSSLYAAGDFALAGGIVASNIAEWNGSSWSSLGSGLNQRAQALVVSGGNVYAGGYFTSAGGTPANYLAQWNGSSWSSLGSGVNSSVGVLALSGSNLYAGGGFTTAGGTSASCIAQWNGTNWSPLGSGVSGVVNALAASGGNLYAGGEFAAAGGASASHVAQWNGASWSALGSGVTGSYYFDSAQYGPFVNALAVSGGNLYVGGEFTSAGGTTATNIAQWNGINWSALGSGVGTGFGLFPPSVNALVVSGGTLFAAGDFGTAGTNAAASVAEALLNGTPIIQSPMISNPSSLTLDLVAPYSSSRLYAATNLIPPINWQPIDTNANGGLWQFTDTNTAGSNLKFYRASTP